MLDTIGNLVVNVPDLEWRSVVVVELHWLHLVDCYLDPGSPS